MNRSTACVLAVAVVVVLAGCGGLGSDGTPGATADGNGEDGGGGADGNAGDGNGDGSGGSDGGDGDGEFVVGGDTPADVAAVAPGIGEDAGLVNETALLTAHREALVEAGFAFRFEFRETERVVDADRGGYRRVGIAKSGNVTAEAGLVPALVVETDDSTDPATTTVRYAGPDVGAERVDAAGNVTVATVEAEPGSDLATHYTMGNYLAREDWSVATVRNDSVVLEAGPAWTDWDTEFAGNRNVSTREFFRGRLVVSREGVIRRFVVNETSVERVLTNGSLSNEGTTTRTVEYELRETGDVDVERPAWVASLGNGTATDAATRDREATDAATRHGEATGAATRHGEATGASARDGSRRHPVGPAGTSPSPRQPVR